ncbi:putative holin-like toxin [Virgibacillus salexigens]
MISFGSLVVALLSQKK